MNKQQEALKEALDSRLRTNQGHTKKNRHILGHSKGLK